MSENAKTINKLAIPHPHNRPRRLRYHPSLRQLVSETALSPNDFVAPLFIKAGLTSKQPIPSMPGQYQLALTDLPAELDAITACGIPAVLLFGIPEHKDATGSAACHDNGIVQQATRIIKQHSANMLVITDLCFCEYTDHGHCGEIQDGDVDNDRTLAMLCEQALSHVRAGADVIAPSGMMDGAIAALRHALDVNHYTKVPILSYAVKYASALYGPFRDAAEGAPQFGDRKTYQMDIANGNEAIKEASLDIDEGADMLMVKPALAYLDVIHQIKRTFPEMPLAAYHVSGEYAMVKAAGANGWLDEQAVMHEHLLSIKRAGADIIISYAAVEVCQRLKS